MQNYTFEPPKVELAVPRINPPKEEFFYTLSHSRTIEDVKAPLNNIKDTHQRQWLLTAIDKHYPTYVTNLCNEIAIQDYARKANNFS